MEKEYKLSFFRVFIKKKKEIPISLNATQASDSSKAQILEYERCKYHADWHKEPHPVMSG